MNGGEGGRPEMSLTAGALAERVAGELIGDSRLVIAGVDALEFARACDASFVRDARFWPAWLKSRCGVAIVSRGAMASAPPMGGRPVIVVADADHAVIALLAALSTPTRFEAGVHASAVVDPSAVIGPGAHVGPGAVVGAGASIGEGSAVLANAVIEPGVSIGASCVIDPTVVVRERCVLGDFVVLHPGVVIGADGFGYHPDAATRMPMKIPHIGNVVIESHVEIGANSAVDRGKFGATRIGTATKIDNLVQIGHNCRIGRACIICGMCGLAGSVTLGDGVTLAGRVAVCDGRTIGAGATVGAGSGVMNDIPAGETWLGAPARPAKKALRIFSSLDDLPDLASGVRRLLKSQAEGAGRMQA